MSRRTCSVSACDALVKGRGLCARHYERERLYKPKRATDVLLRSRARGRAAARLIDTHRQEFDRLNAEELAAVRVEHLELVEREAATVAEQLAAADVSAALDYAERRAVEAATRGPLSADRGPLPVVAIPFPGSSITPPRLLPGPRPDGHTVEDRLREDVGRCGRCAGHHDGGHRCPECANRAERAIANAIRAGKTPEWIVATAGESPVLVRKVAQRLRQQGDAELAKLRATP